MTRDSAVPHRRKDESAPFHPKRILFAADFSRQANKAFHYAVWWNRRFGGKLYSAHAIPAVYYAVDAGKIAPALRDSEIEIAHKKLQRYVARVQDKQFDHEEIVASAVPKELIREMVESRHIDLVVMGSHGRGGLGKLTLGSVAESVLRHLNCPILICGPHCKQNPSKLESIVLATRMSLGSLRPIEYAVAIAGQFKAQLTVTHILPHATKEIEAPQMECAAAEIERAVPSATDLHPCYCVKHGNPAEQILRVAKERAADLIVMGVDEKGRVADHFPWTTISQVIRMARCPILTVPPPISI